MRDSVENFLTSFDITEEAFLKFVEDTCIFVDYEKGKPSWDIILNTISNGDLIHARSYGDNKSPRNLTKPQIIVNDFYKHYFGINSIKFDPDNNKIPNQRMEEWTGFKKNKSIVNYKLSHIWEKSLNPYVFNAPWNLVFTSIFIDPLTGHESSGNLRDKVKEFIKGKTISVYHKEIAQYNEIMSDKSGILVDFLKRDFTKEYNISNRQDTALRNSLINSFSPIDLIEFM